MSRNLQPGMLLLRHMPVVVVVVRLLLLLRLLLVLLRDAGVIWRLPRLEYPLLEVLWGLRVSPLQAGALRSGGAARREVGGVARGVRVLGAGRVGSVAAAGLLVNDPDGDGLGAAPAPAYWGALPLLVDAGGRGRASGMVLRMVVVVIAVGGLLLLLL